MITKHRTGYVFKRGRNYYVQYMVNGRRVKQVLRDKDNNPITTIEDAEARCKEVMAPLMVADQEEVVRTVQHRLDDAAKERDELERGTDAEMTLDAAWEAYVASVNRPDSGPRTLKGYEAQWQQFVEWVAKTRPMVTELRQVSAAVAEAYAEYMLKEVRGKQKNPRTGVEEEGVLKRSFSTNTFNKHVRLLELVFRVLARKAGLTGNPWADVSRKTENKASRRELTVQELNTICNRASGELQALLVLGIYTGLRLGDCCTLRWSEVDMDRKIVLRVPNKTARRKGLPVHVPIHPTLLRFLSQTPAKQRTGFVLPEHAAIYRDNDTEVAKRVRRHLIRCGIQVHKEGTGFKRAPSRGKRMKNVHTGTRAVVEVGFHSLRHSFVSLCRQSNAPLAVVEAIVGHSNPAMTRHYTHVGEVAAGAAVAALPAIGTGEKVHHEGTKNTKGSGKQDGNLAEMARLLEGMTAENWEVTRAKLLAVVKAAVGG
jgi:integrase